MKPEEQSAAANARLGDLYGPVLEPWRNLRVSNPGLSIPMFLKTTPTYFAVKPRLVFVGQETHGWWTDAGDPIALGATEIMDFYQGEVMTKYRLHSSSPFWRAIRKISDSLGLPQFPDSVMSANLFPCDSEKAQAPAAMLETMRSWRILPEELNILDPEVVVFFAGPVYAYNLGYYFGTPVAPSLSSKNLVQTYRPGTVGWKGWVTYHPASLQRSGHNTVLDEIAEGIRQA
jgi:hypothetical protein